MICRCHDIGLRHRIDYLDCKSAYMEFLSTNRRRQRVQRESPIPDQVSVLRRHIDNEQPEIFES